MGVNGSQVMNIGYPEWEPRRSQWYLAAGGGAQKGTVESARGSHSVVSAFGSRSNTIVLDKDGSP